MIRETGRPHQTSWRRNTNNGGVVLRAILGSHRRRRRRRRRTTGGARAAAASSSSEFVAPNEEGREAHCLAPTDQGVVHVHRHSDFSNVRQEFDSDDGARLPAAAVVSLPRRGALDVLSRGGRRHRCRVRHGETLRSTPTPALSRRRNRPAKETVIFYIYFVITQKICGFLYYLYTLLKKK